MSKSTTVKIQKNDGTLRKKYRDMPRYRVIFGYEKSFTDNFEDLSKQMVKEVIKEITTVVKMNKKQ